MAKSRIDKLPICCADPSEFEAGDILIFDINAHQAKPKNATIFGQSLLNNSGGHKETVHAAFVVEIDGKKKIAHLRANGFVLNDLDIVKTTTHIYRPTIYQKEIAEKLSQLIQNNHDEFERNLKWRTVISLFAFVRRLVNAIGVKDENLEAKPIENVDALPSPKRFISSSSICSKFLSESYITSCHALSKEDKEKHDYQRDLMNIEENTIPKTLQAYLYRCSNYQYLVMPHKNFRGVMVAKLKELIEKEMIRLQKSHEPKVIAKVKKLQESLEKFDAGIGEEKHENPDHHDFEEAKRLLTMVIPALKINTGNNVKTPTSYKNVLRYAESQGLYESYFRDHFVFNSAGNDLTEQAKLLYDYNDEQAHLYSEFRKLGYSDQEARFECRPNFCDWYKLSPYRNIAASITVLPFLFWSLPYGLNRVKKAQAHNVVHENAISLTR